MIIVINARFLTQKISGVQRFAIEISKKIHELLPNVEFVCPYNIIDIELGKLLKVKIIGKNKGVIWEQTDLPLYLKKHNSPLLLNLCNTAPVFYKNKIITIHDLAFLRGNWHDKYFRFFYRLLIPKIIRSSKHIVTVSQFSKKELMDIYKIKEDKISIIYNAAFLIKEKNYTDLHIQQPYILSVGSVDPRKNLKRLILAFLKLKQDNVILCLTGGFNKNFNTDPEFMTILSNNPEKIVFLGYRRDDELIGLYKNAICFVYPSLYEGFGLPPIEAMSNDCPIITSNVSSLPEVCGKAALYCNPYDVNDISKKMALMIENPEQRKEYIKLGRENVKRFSWGASGQKFVDVLDHFTNS